MTTVLLVLITLWGASITAVALWILCMWLFDRTHAEPQQTDDRTEPEWIAPRPRLRVLEPDPDLLVPWSAVRSSKRRMGVEEAAPSGGEAIPRPRMEERTPFRRRRPVH